MDITHDGPDGGSPVLLLHGLGASTRSWDALTPLLAADHHVVRVDLLGHGRSPAPDDGRYDVPAQASRVAAALDQAGIDEVTAVGHSTGGAIAVSLAEQRPGLVHRLVLINTGPGLDALIAPEIAVGPTQWPHLTDDQIRGAMNAAFSRPGWVIPQELVDDVRAVSYEAFAATLSGSHDYLRERTLPQRLRSLDVPLLVIFGADDRRWRSSSAADYEAVPDAVVHLLPGLGHSPILEDPPRTAGPLLEFLAAQELLSVREPSRSPRSRRGPAPDGSRP